MDYSLPQHSEDSSRSENIHEYLNRHAGAFTYEMIGNVVEVKVATNNRSEGVGRIRDVQVGVLKYFYFEDQETHWQFEGRSSDTVFSAYYPVDRVYVKLLKAVSGR